ncbi:shufflon system plasmid conjugative transfer pilus tip adhesin PilV [Salmonella enterica]|nr:shufflon system plasmid conjugative transfer pilus tip adhesin PilV [Salmonella enterica]EJC8747836.1 shufflon system plasmid conjugative transfer pilus tip adhesin PilV [Salmonella enterica]HCM1648897.1 shufflon system plasmid conjugative transfer pilus tip adhesin PilV [Salmonella enterica subsp. diarizonae serovar 48:i:z35]
MTFIKFQNIRNEQEDVLASSVGQQMKQIGEAVNGYINIRYDKLSTLSNAAGNGTDPGPRTCSATVCEITYQTLVNEGLLPSSFSGVNSFKSPYKILLRRDGTSPNYIINGLITTSSPWIIGKNIRFDLLGRAMQSAGIDSGMSRADTVVSGLGGEWKENTSNFKNITEKGLLAYRVGFNSSMYTVYLRRDGSLPMSGDLNMGGNNINNVKDITSSGIISTGSLKTIGAGSVGGKLLVSGSSEMLGVVAMKNGLSVDGISTLKGELIVKNNITASRDINSLGRISASGNITSSSDIYSTGRLTTNEYLQINGKAIAGSSCSSNGLVGISSDGKLLPCSNGKWKSADGSGSIGFFAFSYRNINDHYFETGHCYLPNINTGSCSCLPDELAVSVVTNTGKKGSKRIYLCLKSTISGRRGYFY